MALVTVDTLPQPLALAGPAGSATIMALFSKDSKLHDDCPEINLAVAKLCFSCLGWPYFVQGGRQLQYPRRGVLCQIMSFPKHLKKIGDSTRR